MSRRFSLIGLGRAGGSLRTCLTDLGWECAEVYGRSSDVSKAALDVDVCIIATPDRAIEEIAAQIEPGAVVLHLSGALGLDVLAPHRCAGLHPLVSLADADSGAAQLRHAWFAIAGDPIAEEMATQLSGRHFEIADEHRATYHAAAAVASNHLVALLGQVERIAASIDVPFDVFLPLISGTVDNVARMGPAAALTGPAARGDHETIARHRVALSQYLGAELAAYDAMVDLAVRLVDPPSDATDPPDPSDPGTPS